MTNMKSTKRALLSSVLALFLCFSMLLGTTFAWFTDSVGATGKAVYNNCVFDSWAICASSGAKETYFNGCNIAILNASSDFDSGNVYVKESTVEKAEYSFRSASSVMNFENCEIGELISWNANTVLTNCTVTTLDDTHMTTGTITRN